MYLGDIAVSRKTIRRLLKSSPNSEANLPKAFGLNAYPDTTVDLWDENFVNGQYVIAYQMNAGLDLQLIDMLPKVSPCFKSYFFDRYSVIDGLQYYYLPNIKFLIYLLTVITQARQKTKPFEFIVIGTRPDAIRSFLFKHFLGNGENSKGNMYQV